MHTQTCCILGTHTHDHNGGGGEIIRVSHKWHITQDMGRERSCGCAGQHDAQRNINATDLNHFKCKCLWCRVMQMQTERRRLKLFPLLNANIFFNPLGFFFVMGKATLTDEK